MKLPKITKLPSGAYHARCQIGGRRVSLTYNTSEEVEQAIYRLRLNKRTTSQNTLSECITEYIDSKNNILSPSTIRGYGIIQRNRFKTVMYMPVNRVKNWQKIVNQESLLVSPKTLKNSWGLVRTVLEYNGIDPGRVTLPPVVIRERSFLQPDEIKEFISAVHGHRYEIAYLACLHGLRASEMLALDKIDIDDEIHVNKAAVRGADNKLIIKKMTKNATSTRSVPVFVPRLTELVSAAPSGRLVTVTDKILNKHLKRLCIWSKLPPITLHELRHSYVSLMYHLGISEAQAMQFGGYADIQTMRKIYTHLATEDRKNAIKKLQSFIA